MTEYVYLISNCFDNVMHRRDYEDVRENMSAEDLCNHIVLPYVGVVDEDELICFDEERMG